MLNSSLPPREPDRQREQGTQLHGALPLESTNGLCKPVTDQERCNSFSNLREGGKIAQDLKGHREKTKPSQFSKPAAFPTAVSC